MIELLDGLQPVFFILLTKHLSNSTVKASAMYSSEFIAVQSMGDQTNDLQYTLHMMGVPLDHHS